MATLNEGMLFSLERVKSMRATLRKLIATLSPEQLITKHTWSGTASVIDTLMHIIDCEFVWVQGVLSQNAVYTFSKDLRYLLKTEELHAIPAIPDAVYAEALGLSSSLTRVYAFQDALTESTREYVRNNDIWNEQDYRIPWHENKIVRFSPWLILNHVMTHEFHNKGQIIGMCRAMGITEIPETDFA